MIPDKTAVLPSVSTRAATLCGAGAILLWGFLAVLTTEATVIPPFEMAALTFGIAGGLGLIFTVARGQLMALRQSPLTWLVGVGGLFGYHALYFAALRLAPAAEANLINYLWPLLIVFLSGLLLPGETITYRHVLGALLGFLGVLTLGLGNSSSAFTAQAWLGFALALCSSITWALYSVLSRRLEAVPSDAVTGFCIATAILALICHRLFEVSIWPTTPNVWLAILLAGLGPVGAAFFLWDIGMKRGNITFLGVASYATPILSTLTLIATGRAAPTPALFFACILIVGGAFVATRQNRT